MGYAIFKKIYDEDINKFSQNIMDFWKDNYAIFKKIYDEDINKFSQNIMDFWKDNGMGILEIEVNGDVIEVTNYDCFECELLPKTGTPSCYLDAGILEACWNS